jgi:hypothetical protein
MRNPSSTRDVSMKQLKISLTNELRRHLETISAASGHSLAEEIRRRLERTLTQDRSDRQTRELLAAIDNFADLVKRETGHAWHSHPGSHAVLHRAIASRLDRCKPEGAGQFQANGLPEGRTITPNTHAPTTMGYLIDLFDLRSRHGAKRQAARGESTRASAAPQGARRRRLAEGTTQRAPRRLGR